MLCRSHSLAEESVFVKTLNGRMSCYVNESEKDPLLPVVGAVQQCSAVRKVIYYIQMYSKLLGKGKRRGCHRRITHP